MAETQVRISDNAHEILRVLADQAGLSEQEIVERAIEQYRRKSFLDSLSNDFLSIRDEKSTDPEDELERALWDNTLQDGLETE